MNKSIISLLLVLAGCMLTACNNYETYADKKEKERNAIRDYIEKNNIKVIEESVFKAQGNKTDTTNNEYVYMNNSGVYMQIVHEGCGKPLQDGERSDVIVRFIERGLLDSTAVYNDSRPQDYDLMNITRAGSTFTASFTKGVMYSTYGESVPTGWLVPFNYVRLGHEDGPNAQISKVKLIVPHTQGHGVASSYVYPYVYEIRFMRLKDI